MKLILKGEIQTVNGFKAQEITDSFKKSTLILIGAYNSYSIDFLNDDIEEIKKTLKDYKPGSQAEVTCYLNSRESKGKYWTSLRGKSINLTPNKATTNTTTNSQNNSEDLPF